MRAAAALACDMSLSSVKTIMERTITRGQFIIRRFTCPAVILSIFTEKAQTAASSLEGKLNET